MSIRDYNSMKWFITLILTGKPNDKIIEFILNTNFKKKISINLM